MKRVVQILTLALLVAGLTLPSLSFAGKINGSGMTKHKTFTEKNVPVQQNGSIVTKAKPISGWRLAIGTLFSGLRWPGITIIVIIDTPTDKDERPLDLQDPPWEKRPATERPQGDDHGWGDT